MTTTPDAPVKTAVRQAYDSLRIAYPNTPSATFPDGQGGMWIEFGEMPLGPTYIQDTTFLVFLLPFTLPGSDIYPMFVRHDLSRADGAELGPGFGLTQLDWPAEATPRPVTQLSRRTKGGAFTAQTAAQKMAKVLDWLESR